MHTLYAHHKETKQHSIFVSHDSSCKTPFSESQSIWPKVFSYIKEHLHISVVIVLDLLFVLRELLEIPKETKTPMYQGPHCSSREILS